MHGGLFSDVCTACGRESSGTYGPAISEMPSASVNRVSVRWAQGKVTASALKALREVSTSAMSMRLPELSEIMDDGKPFELGVVGENARARILPLLERVGFIIKTELIS